MLNSFFKDSFSYSIPSFFSKGISIFLIPLYTRFLSPEDYGVFDLFIVFMNIINLTIAFEISQGVARYYIIENSNNEKRMYASTAFWFSFFSYLIFALVCLIFSSEFSFYILGSKNNIFIFQVGVVYIFINGLLQLVQNQFRWQMLSLKYMINSILHVVLTSLTSIVLIYYMNFGIDGLFIGLLVGSLVPLIIGYYQLRTTFLPTFKLEKLITLLKFTTPLVPASISVWIISYVDRILIQYFHGPYDVGIYGIGHRISSVILIVMVGFQTALTPLIYKHYEDKNTPSQIALLFKSFLFFIAVCCLILIVFLPNLLKFFISPQFFESEKVIVLLIPSLIFSQLYIFFPGLSIMAKTKYILYINLVGGLINLLLNLFLVQYFSYIGASVASLISQIFVFTAFIFFSQKFYFVKHDWVKIFPFTIIFSLIYSYFSYFSSSFNYYYYIDYYCSFIILLAVVISILMKLIDLSCL